MVRLLLALLLTCSLVAAEKGARDFLKKPDAWFGTPEARKVADAIPQLPDRRGRLAEEHGYGEQSLSRETAPSCSRPSTTARRWTSCASWPGC